MFRREKLYISWLKKSLRCIPTFVSFYLCRAALLNDYLKKRGILSRTSPFLVISVTGSSLPVLPLLFTLDSFKTLFVYVPFTFGLVIGSEVVFYPICGENFSPWLMVIVGLLYQVYLTSRAVREVFNSAINYLRSTFQRVFSFNFGSTASYSNSVKPFRSNGQLNLCHWEINT